MIRVPERLRAIHRATQTGIGRGLFVIVSAAFVSVVFAHHSVLHGVERWTFDILAKLDPPTPRGVVVVDIDDAAYDELFDGTSPLDPAALRRLVDAVAQGRPRAIGVDIDTSSRRFAGFEPDPAWPPIVWARATRPVAAGSNAPGLVRSGEHALSIAVALGRSDPRVLANAAIPVVLADDADRRVRRYQQVLRVGDDASVSFPRRVAEVAGASLAPADGRARIIRYAPTDARLRIGALDAMALGATEGWRSPAGPLHGRIVLLGGSYAGLDRHATPHGQMKGVDILANVVETELDGGGATDPGWFRVFAIQIFGAVFVGLLLYTVRSRPLAAAIFVGAVAVLAPLSSLLAYGALDRWLYFGLVYAASAANHVISGVKASMSLRQDAAVQGAFDELRGHWRSYRQRRGTAQPGATDAVARDERRSDAPQS